MTVQAITITLPEEIYRQVKQQSQQMQRTVAEEVTAAVMTTAQQNQLPADLEAELAQLDLFTDEELWRAAKLTASKDKTDRMQVLVEKQQLEGLTEIEKQESELLSHYFNRVMLVRAKAAVLLKR